MKRLIGFLLFIVIIGGLGFYLIKRYLPNLVPPSKNIKQYLPLNGDTPSPIRVPQGGKMDTFFDLRGEMPRALAFDQNDTLVVSLTSIGKVSAIIDEDKNLKAEKKIDILSNLNKPHGIAFDKQYLYVAETNGVSRYFYDSTTKSATGKELILSLPAGGRHSTRTIRIYNDKLYTSIGSSCDACVEKNELRASIIVSNLDGTDKKTLASGLRNTVFFDFDSSGQLWGADMGRDNLGDNLPPDEINIIDIAKINQNYGWPHCYGNKVNDYEFTGNSPYNCQEGLAPAFELPAHSAPLGVRFDDSGNLLVAMHGSWNSSTKVGYKIVILNIFAGQVTEMKDYLSGFLTNGDDVLGRPVDLIFDKNHNLFISDDKSGLIYVLSK